MVLQQNMRILLSPRLPRKMLWGILLFFFLLITIVFFRYRDDYTYYTQTTGKTEVIEIYPTQTALDNVLRILEAKGVVLPAHTNAIRNVLTEKGVSHIKVGRYNILQGMKYNKLFNILLQGRTTVGLVINHVRTLEEVAGKIGEQVMADSLFLLETLKNPNFVASLGFDKYTLLGMFISNTYEVYWHHSPEELCRKIRSEYDRFWNENREAKRKLLKLSKNDVVTLASIVESETVQADEMPIVAGLYLNRLRQGIKLEADPTAKYATGDLAITRVLYKHLKTESPYNTYLHYGLPPGPIRAPSVVALEATLNYQKHDYIFMCAKGDGSGLHNFAKTNSGHNKNVKKYREALKRKRR